MKTDRLGSNMAFVERVWCGESGSPFGPVCRGVGMMLMKPSLS